MNAFNFAKNLRPPKYKCYTVCIHTYIHVLFIFQGELLLKNINDGSEQVYLLKGVADKPLAQDHIVLHAQANTRSDRDMRTLNCN